MTSGRTSVDTGRIARIVALVATAAVVLAVCFRTIAAPSIWSSLAAGRAILSDGIPRTDVATFTATGTAWLDVRWLFDLLVILAWKIGGAGLIVAAKTAVVAAALALAARHALRHAPPAAAAVACILIVTALAPRLDAVSGVFAMPFAAAVAFVMSGRPRPGRDFAILVPVQIVWINLDPCGILGPVIAAACAAATWADYQRGAIPGLSRPHLNARLATPLALAAACMVSPYGPAHLLFIAAHAAEFFQGEGGALLPSLAAFHDPPPSQILLTGILAISAIGMIAPRKALPAHPLALAIIGVVVLFNVRQAMPLFAVLIVPFFAFALLQIAAGADRLLREALRYPRGFPPAAAVVFAPLAAAWALAVVPGHLRRAGDTSRPGAGVETAHLATGAASLLGRPGFPARILCLPSDGSYLMWQLPGRAVFADLRGGLHAPQFTALLERFLGGDAAARDALFQRWRIEGVALNMLVSGAAPAAQQLLAGGAWRLVYFDGVSAVLLAATADHAAWIRDAAVQQPGLDALRADAAAWEDSVQKGRRPAPSPRLAGAALAFSAFGRHAEAASAYDLLLRGDPDMRPVNLHLGVSRAAAGRATEALDPLRRYCAAYPDSARGWSALARTYRMAGLTNEADAAQHKAEIRRAP
ncbi:MAG: hypothetical protein KJ579_07730 [Verrucomicrobia bacterium]|nr:hypothetical protein [Verrucomicrobiota bacterium]